MMSQPPKIIKQHPLAAFFVLATALSWSIWPLYALDLTPTPMFGVGPFVAALVVLVLTRGKAGIVDLLRRMGRWRVGLRWYAAALLLPVVVTFTAAAINVFLLGAETSKSAAELGGWSSLVPTFLILLLVPGLGGTWEEPGFRGYALPRLQAGRSALAASLVLGVLWALWHLPLFLTGLDAWNESVQIIAWTVVFAWLLNNTGQSVLMAMLMHNMSNTISGSFVSQMFSGADSVNQAWIRGALWCVVAVAVVIATGPAHLSRRKPNQALTAPRLTQSALSNSSPHRIEAGSQPVTDEAPPRLAGVAERLVVRQLQVPDHRPVPVHPPRLPQVHAHHPTAERAVISSDTPQVVCLHETASRAPLQTADLHVCPQRRPSVPIICGSRAGDSASPAQTLGRLAARRGGFSDAAVSRVTVRA